MKLRSLIVGALSGALCFPAFADQGEWTLIVMLLTSEGRVEGGAWDKKLTLDRCEAIGMSKVDELAPQYDDATYVCLAKGRKAPVRAPVKKTS